MYIFVNVPATVISTIYDRISNESKDGVRDRGNPFFTYPITIVIVIGVNYSTEHFKT